MLSAPAPILATSEATFSPGVRSIVGRHRWPTQGQLTEPADRVSARPGPSPADDTRRGWSNTSEVARGVWQSCTFEMPFVTVESGP